MMSSKMDENTPISQLIEYLDSSEKETRERAAERLGKLRDPIAVDALIHALTDESSDVRRSVLLALRRIGDKRAIVPMTNMLRDGDTSVRRRASAWMMSHPGDQAMVEPLIDIMLDEQCSLGARDFAAMMLGKLGDKRAVEPLHQLLFTVPELRTRAIHSIMRLRDKRSIPVLIKLRDNSDDIDERLENIIQKTLAKFGET
jgi:HEAT repeat protein